MDKYEISVETFNKLARKYQEKYMDFEFYHDTYDTFCELIQRKNATILDIACGPGNVTRYLLNKRPDFIIEGIDLAPNMVELACANNPSAHFQVMDSRSISSINKTYDAIMCGFCTPYLSREDVARLISDARALLDKGGIFYLSTMEDDYEKSGFQTSGDADQVYIHYHPWKFLKDELRANGFEALKVQRKNFPVEEGNPVTDLFIFARAC